MKYIVYMLLYFPLIFVQAASIVEGNLIDSNKINQDLDTSNLPTIKKEKEQEILKVYNERLNLLSIKERQLNSYEKSLNSIKVGILALQLNNEEKENKLNEKEIELVKKELELKEKERKLAQLEERLAQVDNNQLMRDSYLQKMTIDSLKLDTNFLGGKNVESSPKEVIKQEVLILPEKIENKVKRHTVENTKENKDFKIKRKNELNSGLDGMKKEVTRPALLTEK